MESVAGLACDGDCFEYVDSLDLDVSDSRTPCNRSAKNGHLACLRFAHEEGLPWDECVCAWASDRGHLECLRYAHENGCPWDEATSFWASESGHLDCLRYAHEHGCPWDEETCFWASKEGQLNCLRYAHEHGCPWDERTTMFASIYGHLECLAYALDNGCPAYEFGKSYGSTPHRKVVPFLHHRGFELPKSNDADLRDHIREHVQRAWCLVRCIARVLGSYREACERVYTPDGVGYREAEFSFRETAGLEGTLRDEDLDPVSDDGPTDRAGVHHF